MFWTLRLQVLPHVLSASLPIPRRSPSLLLFPNWMRIGCGGSVTMLSPTFYWLVFMPRFALFYPLMMMMTLRLLAPLAPSIRFYASLTVYTATPLAPPSIPNFVIFHVVPGYRTLSLVGVVGCRNFIRRVILFSIRDIIEVFLDKLPTSVPFQILRFKYMDQIDDIPVTDIKFFFKITDEVLDIDSLHKRTHTTSTTQCLPPPHPPVSSVSLSPAPVLPSTPLPSVPTARPPRSSLICSNCHTVRHTVDKCFKHGGGLEGKRDEYLAGFHRAQAHLAQLVDIVEGNMVDSDTVPPDISIPPEPDIIVDLLPTSVFSA